jgi:hypothetical protein
VLLVVSIVVDYLNKIYWRSFLWFILIFVSITIFRSIKNLSLNSNLIINLVILSNILGELFLELFYTVPYYDKFLHVLTPFFLFFVIYNLFKPHFKDSFNLLINTLIFILFLSFLWEFLEVGFDYYFDAPLIGVFIREPLENLSAYQMKVVLDPLTDTLYDLLASALGGLTAYFLVTLKQIKNSKKTKLSSK